MGYTKDECQQATPCHSSCLEGDALSIFFLRWTVLSSGFPQNKNSRNVGTVHVLHLLQSPAHCRCCWISIYWQKEYVLCLVWLANWNDTSSDNHGNSDFLALGDLLPKATQKLLWQAFGLGLKVPDQVEEHQPEPVAGPGPVGVTGARRAVQWASGLSGALKAPNIDVSCWVFTIFFN